MRYFASKLTNDMVLTGDTTLRHRPAEETAKPCFVRALSLLVFLTLCPAWCPHAQAQGLGRMHLEPETSSPNLLPSDIESVEGTVLNRATQEPIARALVHTPDNQYATLTDDRGHFQLKFLPVDETALPTIAPDQPDSWLQRQAWQRRNNRPNALIARRPDFLQDSTRMTVENIKDEHAQVVLTLEPEALIVGHVQFPGTDNTERIGVTLYRQEFQEGREQWTQASSFHAWASGEFRFAELPAGTYKLFTEESMENTSAAFNEGNQAFGYPPVFYPNATDFASAAPIRVASGATVTVNVRVARKPYYPVKIAIGNAQAANGIPVVVYPRNHPGPGYSLGYDMEEQLVRGMLPDGTYTLKVFQLAGGGATGTLDFVVRGGPVEGLTVATTPNGTVTIDIARQLIPSEATGNTFPEQPGDTSTGIANIALTTAEPVSPQAPMGPRSTTATSDKVIMEHVTPGTYWLNASGNNCYVASATWGGRDALQQPIIVDADNTSIPIEVTLRNDGAEVSGVVTSDSPSSARRGPKGRATTGGNQEEPAAQAFVYFLPLDDSSGEYRQVQSGSEGNFQTMQLPPGRYRIVAFEKEHGEIGKGNPDARKKFESEGIVVELAPKQTLQLPAALRLVSEP